MDGSIHDPIDRNDMWIVDLLRAYLLRHSGEHILTSVNSAASKPAVVFYLWEILSSDIPEVSPNFRRVIFLPGLI